MNKPWRMNIAYSCAPDVHFWHRIILTLFLFFDPRRTTWQWVQTRRTSEHYAGIQLAWSSRHIILGCGDSTLSKLLFLAQGFERKQRLSRTIAWKGTLEEALLAVFFPFLSNFLRGNPLLKRCMYYPFLGTVATSRVFLFFFFFQTAHKLANTAAQRQAAAFLPWPINR